MRDTLLGALTLLILTTPPIPPQSAPTSLDGLLSQAVELEKARDYGGAEKAYRRVLVTSPDDPEILKRLGIVCQEELKFKESIEVFQEILKRAPVYPAVNLLSGISYYALNQFDASAEAMRKELAANPKDRQARYYLALALHASERNLEAIQQLESLLADHPGDIAALYQLAQFYKDGAQEASQQVAKLAPDSELYLALRAQAFADNDRLDEAIRQYKAVLSKNPGFPGIHFELGQVYWKKKDAEGARAELKLALQEDPNQPLANFYLADILTNQKEYPRAIPHLQITIAAYPKMTKAYFLLGKCYAGIGDLPQALRAFQQASDLDPKYQEVHYQLYRLYARLNNKRESERHLEIVKRLQQEDSKELRENVEKSGPQQTKSNTNE
jgi:tetratricopeptide (TPR) repeat protein